MKPPEELRGAGMRVSRDRVGALAVSGSFKLNRHWYYSTILFLVLRHLAMA
jgi:hypothetical protein